MMVTCRPWPEIESLLRKVNYKTPFSFEMNAEFISEAVALFTKYKVDKLAQENGYDLDVCDTVLDHPRTAQSISFCGREVKKYRAAGVDTTWLDDRVTYNGKRSCQTPAQYPAHEASIIRDRFGIGLQSREYLICSLSERDGLVPCE